MTDQNSGDKFNRQSVYSFVESIFTFVNLALLTLAYSFAWFTEKLSTPFPFGGNVTVIGVYAILLYTFTSLYGGYKIGQLKRFDVINSQVISILFVNGITYLQISLMERSLVLVKLIPFLVLTAADCIIITCWAYIADYVYKRMYPPQNIILIYDESFDTDTISEIAIKINTRKDKFNIKSALSVQDGIEGISNIINECDAVLLLGIDDKVREKIIKYCYEKYVTVYISPSVSDLIIRGAGRLELFDTPLLYCRNSGLTIGQRFVKRAIDIVSSLFLILIFSPFMIIISIAIKICDRGPILFKQRRYTINGKVFNILKFRSMIVDAEKNGEVIPAENNDPRITKIGKVIRKIRMDELPQFFNILKGDMSIVGPRPERVEHVDKYSEMIPEFRYRLRVKGGLTGYAQVMGKYNTSPYDKIRLDLMYIENYSLLLDLKLMLTTLKILLKSESTEGFDNSEKDRKEI